MEETITLPKENAIVIALMLSMHHRIDTDERERIEKIEDDSEKLTAVLNSYAKLWEERRRIEYERFIYLKEMFRKEELRMKEYRNSLKTKKVKK